MGRLNNISYRYGTTSPIHYQSTPGIDGSTVTIPVKFNEKIQNLPIQVQESIKEIPVVIQDFIGTLGEVKMLYGTTQYWDDQPNLFSKKNTIYIYTDKYSYEKEGVLTIVPGIKIGMRDTYLKLIPFVDEQNMEIIFSHIEDTEVHLQEGERANWNNKVTVARDSEHGTGLVFST